MHIGVFDSGIGGEAVAVALREYFPAARIDVVNDTPNLPYGDKSQAEIRALTDAAITPLLGCDAIVIACNSATTAAIDWLRERYPEQFFVGIEPMIKTAAALTTSKIVCVLATPATLSSHRYKRLKQRFGAGVIFLEPDCHDWAALIEQSSINKQHIADAVLPAIDAGADVIVLGCTHYHWIKDEIELVTKNNAIILEPSEAIARRLKELRT